MTSVSAQDIHQAAKTLSGVIRHTPLVESGSLSKRCGGTIRLKLENMQVTGSFKPRGAFIKMASLNAEERQRGVVAMSAGNHAQGVAYHAEKMHIPATIFMPTKTPYIKVERTQAFGAEIILDGDSLYDAEALAKPYAEERRLTIIHPYDDPMIIAGQGSVFVEMINNWPELEQIVVPIGGGGLASGIAIAAKVYNPKIEVIGVQSDYCQSLTQMLFPHKATAQSAQAVNSGHTIAEGITVKNIGKLTSEILTIHLDDIILVNEMQIENAVYTCATESKFVPEGAGAAGVAAVMTNPDRFAGKNVAVVICGGNIDPMTLSAILNRGLARQNKLYNITVRINAVTHPLREALNILNRLQADVADILINKHHHKHPAKFEETTMSVICRGKEHHGEICQELEKSGFRS